MTKQFTKLLLGLMLLMIAGATNAQTNIASYQFSKTTGTYTPIAGGTTILTGTWDSNVSGAIPLGGTFTFGGVAYTTCFVTSNGFLTFGAASTTTTYTPLSTTAATVLGVVSAYAQDGASSTATGSVPLVSYANVGSEFVLQYQNHTNYFNRADTMNFQIRLNLSSGIINIVYGACSNNGTSTSGGTAQVGLRGNTTNWADNVNNLMVANIPAGTTCTWSDAVTGNSNTSSLVYTAGTNANIKIPTGLTYTWTPATTPAPVRTFYAASNITTNSATITWASAIGAAQYNLQYRVPGTCGWTNFTGNPVSDTTVSLNGLAIGTSYQVRVQSASAAGNSIWSHIPTGAAGTGTNGYTATGTFTTTVLCPLPTAVSVDSIRTTSARVNFTSTGNNFIVEFGPTGFTPGTGSMAGTGGTIVTGTSSPFVLTGLSIATSYQVYLRQNCTGAGNGFSTNTTVISFTTNALPPANDACANAVDLTVSSGFCSSPVLGTLAGADSTNGLGGASCTVSALKFDVWYKVRVPASGSITVQTSAVNTTVTDLVLEAYSGICGSLVSIGCNDDGNPDASPSASHAKLGLTGRASGEIVYFRVMPYSNATNAGSFAICAFDTAASILPAVALGTANTCNPAATVTADSAWKYTWVPIRDASGAIIAEVYPNGNILGAITASYYRNTGAVRSAGPFYLDRNFAITPANQPGVSRPGIRLYFTNAELTAFATAAGATTRGQLMVTKNADPCSAAFLQNGNTGLGALNGSGAYGGDHYVEDSVSSFSSFFLHRTGTVLPITLTYLKGLKAGTGNALNWKVNCTSVSITMELERSSDSKNFKSITSITATQARCGQPFDYVDASPLKGTNYYRLKMIDVDGKVSYSPIVAILNGGSGAELVGIYPTVVRDEAFLSVAASRSTKMQINITDMSGRVIKTISQTVANGSSLININTASLSSGVYNITGMLDGVQTKTLRFVKQ